MGIIGASGIVSHKKHAKLEPSTNWDDTLEICPDPLVEPNTSVGFILHLRLCKLAQVTELRLSECQPVRTLRLVVVEGPNQGVEVVADSETATVGTAKDNFLSLTDKAVSRYHVELIALEKGVQVEDQQSTNGTWLGSSRIERALVQPGTVLSVGQSKLRIDDGAQTMVELAHQDRFGQLRGRNPVMRRMMVRLQKAARSDVAVLLIGESGTGKELIARALHDEGSRASEPFVVVDCGAISPGLVASELFGHERGAFTGASRQKTGAFERATGGTLFLDEIGELPKALQSTLLGVLDRGRYCRVGGTAELTTDVRIVAATNRDLRADVNRGKFRLDLYYRLAVVCVKVPPLRERVDDIPLLVEHFLQKRGTDRKAGELVDSETWVRLKAHPWPGNVRELRNIIEAWLVMNDTIRPAPLAPPAISPEGESARSLLDEVVQLPYKQARARIVQEFEAHYLQKLIKKTGGNVAKAARQAQIDRSYLFMLLRRHDLR